MQNVRCAAASLLMSVYLGVSFCAVCCSAKDLLPIPDKLVVLSFDDGNRSDITNVAPLLKKYGFGATFFITEGLGFLQEDQRQHYVAWDDVRQLHQMGFEIGNHTRSHPNITQDSREQMREEVTHIQQQCQQYGITLPTTFCYPGFQHSREIVDVLAEHGFRFARRGVGPEYPDCGRGQRGPAYDPAEDHPLLIPTTGYAGPNWDMEDLTWAIDQATDGKIAVVVFHGVPGPPHPWVSTDLPDFAKYMQYLRDEGCTVIAFRDLAKYVDPQRRASDPYAAIEARLGVAATQLRCEYAANPLGIDEAHPRFSWKLSSNQRNRVQSAYQIIVASSEERLAANVGDKWDSGKVVSDQSVHVVYDGKDLGSGEMCWWKVRCWDQDGRSLGYGGPATFQMGLLTPGDWQGQWIATDPSISSPLLRKEFQITSPIKRATCYISGLGYYELSINGRRVSDHVLDPGNTYYHNDQPLELGSRVLYVTHDVTDHLKSGDNALGVMLGHGWYSAEDDIAPSPSFREPYSDRPILLLQLNIELASGERLSVVSDGSWRTSAGPITYNDYCNGEAYDARREQPGWDTPRLVGSDGVGSDGDDSDWHPAQTVSAPSGQLVAQIMPAIKVVQTIKPVRLLQPKQGVCVFDFGQNFSGWTRLRVRGSQGTKVTIRHGARLYADGSLDNRSSAYECPDNDEDYVAGRPGGDQRYHHCARQTDTYICRGAGTEIWEPRFTLHGFRYAEVTGFPGTPALEDLEGRFVRSDVDTVGKFTCSNTLINQIHSNVCWTLMSSLQGFPQDAADRSERVGWLGDPIPEDYILNYDTALFWCKWLDDLKDSQKPNGDVPVISPLHWRRTFDPYHMSPCWKSTYPIVVWDVYQHYADKRVLERHYRGIEKLVAFLGTQATDHIISAGLGDHMEPQPDGTSSAGPVHTPASLTSTAYYYRDIWILAQAARILGKTDDTAKYDRLAEEVRSAFHRKFFDSDSRSYAAGSQTSNAVPLYFDMVPEEQKEAVLENLVGDILHEHQGHLSTGMLGTNALAQTLARLGRADVMYEIATKTTFPSWGYQVKHGATTLWEAWEASTEPQLSDNMKLFATIDKFFYKDLAGIRMTAPGFKTVAIQPQIVGDLKHVSASVDTIRGTVASSWQRNPGSLSLDVSIPVNCRAAVSVPTLGGKNPLINESGTTVWRATAYLPGAAGLHDARRDSDYVTFDVGSGDYSFQMTIEPHPDP